MKKVNRPYLLKTDTLTAFYETLQEAQKHYNENVLFYSKNIGKYGEDFKIELYYRYGCKTQKLLQSIIIK